ncbi:Transposase IS4 [Popillia japonica]|uniref:Transposase IS4 n=1 Tax=Popillia japonica TaxID=7064 RepID=A0AAW1K0C5_POPJA
MYIYNPQKPHKCGYKGFVLSGVSGFSCDFDFYCGPITIEEEQLDLGASSNVMIKLSETILTYKLFFDNWFTIVPLLTSLTKHGILPLGTVRANRVPDFQLPKELLTSLTKHGILPLGTVRANRVPDFQLPKESDMKKKGRGVSVEKVANVDSVDVSAVSWYDSKIVNYLLL